jgi:hypothetical protein
VQGVRSSHGRIDVLAYEVEALQTGCRLGLHDSDWANLLALAHRYGWRSSAGSDHYLRGHRWIIPASDTRTLAVALEEALRDLPPERRTELRFTTDATGGFVDVAPRTGSAADHKGYFSWQRRWILAEVAKLCQQSAVEIRPM